MLRACIDIGSNTTRLLVAECEGIALREVHQERAFTRIGDSLRRSGRLDAAKLDEVAGVVAGQLDSARRLGVADVRCVATASIRRAANGQDLVIRIAQACGLAVEVLSEAEEARLAFLGAARTLDPAPEGPLAVVDVGGGSSELAVGLPPAEVTWWASLPLGSADLADACFECDPPLASELSDARDTVATVLQGLAPPHPALAVAVGGNATSLRRLVGPSLDAETIGAALETLISLRAAEIASRFALDLERVRLLPAGLVILEAVSALLDAPLQMGRGGLREGILLELGA